MKMWKTDQMTGGVPCSARVLCDVPPVLSMIGGHFRSSCQCSFWKKIAFKRVKFFIFGKFEKLTIWQGVLHVPQAFRAMFHPFFPWLQDISGNFSAPSEKKKHLKMRVKFFIFDILKNWPQGLGVPRSARVPCDVPPVYSIPFWGTIPPVLGAQFRGGGGHKHCQTGNFFSGTNHKKI